MDSICYRSSHAATNADTEINQSHPDVVASAVSEAKDYGEWQLGAKSGSQKQQRIPLACIAGAMWAG